MLEWGRVPLNGRTLRSRIGPGALIVLVHIVLVVVLIRYAGTPSVRDKAVSTTYIAFTMIPVTAKPPAPAVIAAPPLHRHRRAIAQRVQPAPPVPVHIPDILEPDERAPEPEGQPAQPGKLDMEGLRIAARRVERERVPTALESQRDSEQLRADDDSTLAREIKKAKRPNCQTAFAGGERANLLLLIPLAIDTITGKGCKW